MTVTLPSSTATGNGGNDKFAVISGSVEISDLNTGDVLIVSSGAVAEAKDVSNFTATNVTSNAGEATIISAASGSTINLNLVSAGGFKLTGGAGVDNLTGTAQCRYFYHCIFRRR